MRKLLLIVLTCVLLAVAGTAQARLFGRRWSYNYSCKICGKGHYWQNHCHRCDKPHCRHKHCKSKHHCHNHNRASHEGWDWRKRDGIVNNWDSRRQERRRIRQGQQFVANPAPVAVK